MNEELKEWTINYLKHKDMSQKKIVKMNEDEKNNQIIVNCKDKHITYHIIEQLDDKITPLITNHDDKVIVCLNKDENFKFLTKNWKKLAEIRGLNMIFVNMNTHDKWQINPKVHSMIADPDSIEQGLKTMYDTANGKIAELPKGKKKSSMFESNSNEEEGEEDITDN